MTREQQLKFCKKCTNRTLDMNTGLLCGLTGRMADFEDECKSFNLDESVIENMDDSETVDQGLVHYKLSDESLKKLRSEQDFPKAILVGIIVGIIGALLWGTITVATGYQIGFMAIAIGAGVGLSIRYVGKGIDQIFGISGAIIALLSCVVGNFFSIIGVIANYEGLGYFETLTMFDYNQLIPIMTETFSMMDLFFYGIAAYEGYKFSFRAFTEKDLYDLEN